MRGRYRPYYLARDYDRQVLAKGKCLLDGPGDYRPLFGTVEFSSIGFRTAVYSWLAGRPIETMSQPEYDALLYFHCSPAVRNIYEQYALAPAETQQIARTLQVRHPAVREGDVVMSTDYVLTVQDGAALCRRAIAVKREEDLTERVVEKLAIERQYWASRHIPWTLLLDTHIPRIPVENMRLVFDFHATAKLPCSESTAALVRAWLTPHVESGAAALRTLTARCDSALQVPKGTALSVAYHLIVRRDWDIDWAQPIHPCPVFV